MDAGKKEWTRSFCPWLYHKVRKKKKKNESWNKNEPRNQIIKTLFIAPLYTWALFMLHSTVERKQKITLTAPNIRQSYGYSIFGWWYFFVSHWKNVSESITVLCICVCELVPRCRFHFVSDKLWQNESMYSKNEWKSIK